MVASFKSVVLGNLCEHDLVDPAARSNEPLNRSMETCSGLTECSRGSFGLAYTIICLLNHNISVHGLPLLTNDCA